ncbi:sulfurtransferase TusA family protein [Lentilitoribacter sp. EG35]|jgi:tRNA 2-thiouridine synthesizing protein A|uniref:sulfurtransferase TusA family protein n=1 Tax=Lentilitoribacter sp. EG35 TaxID=3234192 RepID=UPI0034610A1D
MKTLDLKGLKCPLPVLRLRRYLRDHAKIGEQIEVMTTDPMAQLDIPHFCNEFNQKLISSSADKDGHVFIVEKLTDTTKDE